MFLATHEPRPAASEHDLLSRDERQLDVRVDAALDGIVDISHPSVGCCQAHIAEERKANDRPATQGRVLVPDVVQGLAARARTFMTKKLTGAQILWECLVREGVTCVFGYPGGAILPAYDAMLDYPIRHVLVRHEQGATHMADGYARASGQRRRGDCDFGPRRDQHGHRHRHGDDGLARRSSASPARCGSKLIGSDAFQETDITGITLPITKHNYLVTRVEDICRRPCARRSTSREVGPARARCWSTSPRTRSSASCEFDWDPTRRALRGYRPDLRPRRGRPRRRRSS